MTRYALPDLNTLPADIQAKILEVQEKSGFIPNVFLALARRPAEWRAFFAYHDALKVCERSHEINDADFAQLAAHGFDDEDAWDIAAITAFFGLSNRVANATGMLPNPEFYTLGRLPRAAA